MKPVDRSLAADATGEVDVVEILGGFGDLGVFGAERAVFLGGMSAASRRCDVAGCRRDRPSRYAGTHRVTAGRAGGDNGLAAGCRR